MKTVSGFIVLLVVGLLAAAPTFNDDDNIIVDADFYPVEFLKYKGEHDIVNLVVPINSLNFEDNPFESSSDTDDDEVCVFFVEADISDDGKRIDKGLYVLKGNVTTKLLDNGRDIAASGDDSKLVFFGAKDGIYVYNNSNTQKYGPFSDSIIAIAKEKDGDVLYILTEDHEVFKIFDNGEKKEKIEDVVDAQEIVLDYNGNLFFYSSDKEVKVRTDAGVTKIKGLPANPTSLKLIRAPFSLENGVPLIVDDSSYIVYENGTSEVFGVDFKPNAKPSAFGMEATLIQYYAFDKKIYEYNILAIILGPVVESLAEEMKKYLEEHTDTIQSVASQAKNSLF